MWSTANVGEQSTNDVGAEADVPGLSGERPVKIFGAAGGEGPLAGRLAEEPISAQTQEAFGLRLGRWCGKCCGRLSVAALATLAVRTAQPVPSGPEHPPVPEVLARRVVPGAARLRYCRCEADERCAARPIGSQRATPSRLPSRCSKPTTQRRNCAARCGPPPLPQPFGHSLPRAGLVCEWSCASRGCGSRHGSHRLWAERPRALWSRSSLESGPSAQRGEHLQVA